MARSVRSYNVFVRPARLDARRTLGIISERREFDGTGVPCSAAPVAST
jgi:hypothetical protein